MFEELSKYFFSSAAIATATVFIAKGIFQTIIKKDLQHYKMQLNHQLEIHKSKLQMNLFEHQTKFSKLYEERATIIKEIYIQLVDVEDYLNIYYSNIKQEKEEVELNQTLFNSVSKFMNYTNQNKIFLTEKISYYIREIEAILRIILNSYEGYYDKSIDYKNNKEWNDVVKQMIDKEIPRLKEELEYEFKKILDIS